MRRGSKTLRNYQRTITFLLTTRIFWYSFMLCVDPTHAVTRMLIIWDDDLLDCCCEGHILCLRNAARTTFFSDDL